jgi:hypothetical protein
MNLASPISLLMFVTLAAALAIALALFVGFMRKRKNRHPMAGQPERNIDEIRGEAPAE